MRIRCAITTLTLTFIVAGCAAGVDEASSAEPAESEGSRVTGGTSGDPPGTFGAGCSAYSPDHVHVTVEDTNFQPVLVTADGYFCDCNGYVGRLHADEPGAPGTFFCREPIGCLIISPDKINIKIGTNSDGSPKLVYGYGYPCSCPTRGVGEGTMRLDNPNSPNTFYCRSK